MAYLLYSRKKVGVSYGGYFKTTGKNALTRLNKIAIGVCIGAFVALLAVVAFSGVNKAIAADKEADETIKAYVDVESGTVTCDVATIVNNSENTVYIASTQVDLTDEAKEVLKDSTFNLKIQSDDLETTLYDKEVPGVMDEIKSLPFESKQSVKASLTITNLDFATAKLLIGKKVLDITFAEKDCWSVVYNSNGAQSGTTPSPQIKEAGKALTLASKPDFVKEGYTLQDYWTTDPADGASATHYNFGAEYTDDANLTLYAA
ncbi:MAG: InlB B-repeat-containing protein [Coriobacteriia bacterium]|nr:InlB B-repeat-containing protein [Coriobacteriia bacterium]